MAERDVRDVERDELEPTAGEREAEQQQRAIADIRCPGRVEVGDDLAQQIGGQRCRTSRRGAEVAPNARQRGPDDIGPGRRRPAGDPVHRAERRDLPTHRRRLAGLREVRGLRGDVRRGRIVGMDTETCEPRLHCVQSWRYAAHVAGALLLAA